MCVDYTFLMLCFENDYSGKCTKYSEVYLAYENEY